MMRHRLLTQLLLATSLVFVLAGCGGGAEEVPVQPVTPVTPDPALVSNPATDPAAATTTTVVPDTDGGDVGGLGSLDGSGNLFAPLAEFDEIEADAFDLDGDGQTDFDTSDEEAKKEEAKQDELTILYTAAIVELDGQTYNVAKGSIFPQTDQLFEVLSIGASSVVVELVAGEFSNGSTGVTLQKGATVSLVNQNEGTTYVLKLIKIGSDGGAVLPNQPSPTG